MNHLKKVFGFLWAVWGTFWFMAVVTPFTFLYALLFFFSGRKYVMQCVWMNCHYLCPFLLWVFGIRQKVHGIENLYPLRTFVFVSNHLAQVDVVCSAAALPQPVKFLAKSEINNIPFFGFMTKMLAIMVDRKSKESREKSIRYMVEELKNGNSIFIYPEGTRNRTNQPLKEFKDGAFRLAIAAQVPIAVQTLVGTKEVNNPNSIQLLPGKVDVYWGTPIETKGMTMADLPILIEKVKAEMQSHL